MNESKAEGVFDQAKGKIKQAFGEATNDQSLANSGAADEVKGHAKETWGSVKDTASDLAHSHAAESTRVHSEHESTGLRDDITNAAQHAKESIQHGLDHLKHKANE
jgi:uncharacterized protein YjbJ (UPF0337 family)